MLKYTERSFSRLMYALGFNYDDYYTVELFAKIVQRSGDHSKWR